MNDFADTCVIVVGTGPVGLMTAWSLVKANQPVLLVEAGALTVRRDPGADNAAEIVDPSRHAGMTLAARRGFGGTSALWGGRAVPLDPIDLASRDWVDHSGWPVDWASLAPWFQSACEFLDCGPPDFEDSLAGFSLGLERWCAQPNIGAVRIAQMTAHPLIRIMPNATATRIVLNGDGTRVTALEIHRDGASHTLPVRACVVAAGGVETARLLLNSRTERPLLFGGAAGPLGRYYMGHIYGSAADIVFDAPSSDASFDYMRGPDGRYLRRRFRLSADRQRAGQLLNAAFWPEAPAIADARHRSAVLSMGYLALAAPILGSRLAAPAIRARKLAGGDGRVRPHLVNILRNPFAAAQFGLGFGAARYLSKIRKPGFFPLNPARRYSLFHHGEHAPNPDSRVTLSGERDGTGMFRARIDLRFSLQDAQSIAGGVAALGQMLAQSRLARLELLVPPEELTAAALSQASDGFHQIGTARMSHDPRHGVVDADARVHGVSNLFLAGSAIFPTSGQANPTLTAVALAARLADHLTRILPSLAPASDV